MYKYSNEYKRKKKIHAHMSNGYRFAVIEAGNISGLFRYWYEAERHQKRGAHVVELRELLENI